MSAIADYAQLYETEIRPRRRSLRYLALRGRQTRLRECACINRSTLPIRESP
jgi:hypothetical protein